MAFRRFAKSRRKAWSPRKKFVRRGPGFARQKFDKIVLFNNLSAGPVAGDPTNGNNAFCGPIIVAACSSNATPPACGPDTQCGETGGVETQPLPCKCCVTRAEFSLINNFTLQSYFQDSVTLVRMYGDIWYRALPVAPFGINYCQLSRADLQAYLEAFRTSYAEQWSWSMRKLERTQRDDELSNFDPASPMFDFDWTESSPPWLWQRHKMWFPNAKRGFNTLSKDSLFGVCSNTTQASYVVPPFADGDEPGWTVPAVQTTCTSLFPTENGVCPTYESTYETAEPPWHHLRISSKKHIKMTRDQDLNLACTVRHPAVNPDLGGWNCIDPAFLPAFPTFNLVNYQFYVRIAATVRLN